jgi:hypothetical protein
VAAESLKPSVQIHGIHFNSMSIEERIPMYLSRPKLSQAAPVFQTTRWEKSSSN